MRFSLLAVVALVLAACGSPAAGPGPMTPTVAPGTATPRATPAYLTTPLTDVRTGERFTLAQVGAGKQVLVMGMAVW